MHPHLARNMGEHLMPVIETDFEGGTRERFDDFSLETDEFFIISHILHRFQQEKILCQHKKRGGVYQSVRSSVLRRFSIPSLTGSVCTFQMCSQCNGKAKCCQQASEKVPHESVPEPHFRRKSPTFRSAAPAQRTQPRRLGRLRRHNPENAGPERKVEHLASPTS